MAAGPLGILAQKYYILVFETTEKGRFLALQAQGPPWSIYRLFNYHGCVSFRAPVG